MTRKIFAVILSVLMISCLFITEVSAVSEKTQDGLKAVITSDKAKYNTGEDINLSFEVTNTNNFDVKMVSLTAQLPKGIKLKNERDNLISETQNLQKGKSLGLNLTVVEDNAKTPLSTEAGNNAAPQDNNNKGSSGNSSGKTVDTGIKMIIVSLAVLLFAVSAILLFVFRKKKSTKNILLLLICSGMVFSAMALLPVKTSAEEIRVMSFTVTDKIIVSDKEYEVSVLVGYNEIKNEEPVTEPATQIPTEVTYVAEDLINKSVSEIVNMMGNEFNVSLIDLGYFYNYEKFPGMDFHINHLEDNEAKLKEFIKSGNATLTGIQVKSPGKGCRNGDKILQADMDFAKCAEIYGKISCQPTGGALISGSPVEALGYIQEKDTYTVTVNFEFTEKTLDFLSEFVNNHVEISHDKMLKENPSIKNIVIRKKIMENKETLRLQKTGYINGTLYYTHDQNFEYVNNGKASILPDNLKDKIGKFFVLDDYIYYIPTHIVGSDGFNVELRRIHFDGSGEELILNDLPYKGKCFYANGGIIYESTDKDSVIYLNLETKQATTLFQKRLSSFWVYGDKIYFVKGYSENDYSIRALSLFDGKEEVVVNSASRLILCDNGYLYYSDLDVDNIKRINLSNLSEQEIVLSEAEIINKHILLSYNEYFGGDNFDISNGVIYYANSSEIRAYDINLKTDIFLSNVQANNEIRKFKCENGYILYTVELEKDTPGSASLAGEYIFDIQNKTTEFVSKYFVSSW